MSDPKEALERLKIDEIANEAVHQWNAAGNPHLSTGAIGVARIAAEIARAGSIAEREGLEREVARLTWLAQKRFEHKVEARTRMEAAESKLSALKEACQPFVNWAADNVECDLSNVDFGAWSGNRCEGERIKDWFGPSDFYRLSIALLHPTVPVERDLGSVACGHSPVSLPRHEQSGSATPSDEPLTEEWVSGLGFKHHQHERQPHKHWTLRLGWAANPRHATMEDLIIEVSPAWWIGGHGDRIGGDGWYCWLTGMNNSMLHVRYLHSQAELLDLIAALTGRPFDRNLSAFGNLYHPTHRAMLEGWALRETAAEDGSQSPVTSDGEDCKATQSLQTTEPKNPSTPPSEAG